MTFHENSVSLTVTGCLPEIGVLAKNSIEHLFRMNFTGLAEISCNISLGISLRAMEHLLL